MTDKNCNTPPKKKRMPVTYWKEKYLDHVKESVRMYRQYETSMYNTKQKLSRFAIYATLTTVALLFVTIRTLTATDDTALMEQNIKEAKGIGYEEGIERANRVNNGIVKDLNKQINILKNQCEIDTDPRKLIGKTITCSTTVSEYADYKPYLRIMVGEANEYYTDGTEAYVRIGGERCYLKDIQSVQPKQSTGEAIFEKEAMKPGAIQ